MAKASSKWQAFMIGWFTWQSDNPKHKQSLVKISLHFRLYGTSQKFRYERLG